MNNSGRHRSSQSGFTLIEVLVALLILLIGLLGVAGMQLLSLQQVNNSNVRSQVNGHAFQAVELVRSNGGQTLSAGQESTWLAALVRDVPGADGEIDLDGNEVVVTITWDEREHGSSAVGREFTMISRLEQ